MGEERGRNSGGGKKRCRNPRKHLRRKRRPLLEPSHRRSCAEGNGGRRAISSGARVRRRWRYVKVALRRGGKQRWGWLHRGGGCTRRSRSRRGSRSRGSRLRRGSGWCPDVVVGERRRTARRRRRRNKTAGGIRRTPVRRRGVRSRGIPGGGSLSCPRGGSAPRYRRRRHCCGGRGTGSIPVSQLGHKA